jgi:hypothetical protein
MPFVKLDCCILDSTLWIDCDARDLFITALLMAEPIEVLEPMAQLEVNSLTETGWEVPAGWYGFVRAAGVGIINRARVEEMPGRQALERLGAPEPDSRSDAFEGRRLIRVNGGFVVLNYMVYRERDYTTAERSKRYRAKKQADEQARRDTTP